MNKLAKRGGPAEVAPIIFNDIEYSVIHFGAELGESQNGGFIVATNAKTKERLWVLKVYETQYDIEKEKDVQDIFIEKIAITNEKLRVTDRLARQFMIKLETKEIVQTRPKPNLQIKKKDIKDDLPRLRAEQEKILAIRRQNLGDENADTLQAMNNLAMTLVKLNELAAAKPLLEQAHLIAIRIFGENHQKTQEIKENLQFALKK